MSKQKRLNDSTTKHRWKVPTPHSRRGGAPWHRCAYTGDTRQEAVNRKGEKIQEGKTNLKTKTSRVKTK